MTAPLLMDAATPDLNRPAGQYPLSATAVEHGDGRVRGETSDRLPNPGPRTPSGGARPDRWLASSVRWAQHGLAAALMRVARASQVGAGGGRGRHRQDPPGGPLRGLARAEGIRVLSGRWPEQQLGPFAGFVPPIHQALSEAPAITAEARRELARLVPDLLGDAQALPAGITPIARSNGACCSSR